MQSLLLEANALSLCCTSQRKKGATSQGLGSKDGSAEEHSKVLAAEFQELEAERAAAEQALRAQFARRRTEILEAAELAGTASGI